MADERSTANESSKEAKADAQDASTPPPGDDFAEAFARVGGLPKIDFPTFLVSLYHSALVHMGEVTPDGQRGTVNKPMAKQSIDIIGMLQDKTKGNLTADEERLLQTMLYELRMKYVNKL